MKSWKTKEWKIKREKFIKDKGEKCELCGSTEKLTVAHPIFKKERWKKNYLSFENCKLLCNKCHFAEHHNMDLCPICKKRYKKINFDRCFDCIPKKEKSKILKKKAIEQKVLEEIENWDLDEGDSWNNEIKIEEIKDEMVKESTT